MPLTVIADLKDATVSLPVVEILKVGLSGLVFLLAFLTHRLLSREQLKEKPNLKILQSVKFFFWQNILLVVLLAGVTIFDRLAPSSTQLHDDCRDSISRLDTLASKEGQTVESMRTLIQNHIATCRPSLENTHGH